MNIQQNQNALRGKARVYTKQDLSIKIKVKPYSLFFTM